jgi:predicted phosphoadenosine phosphosulfate sulfurtransferase
MRPKESGAITENVYGTTRFKDLFTAIINTEHADEPCALLGGVRCEESPSRNAGLTTAATYKHVTWGKAFDKKAHHYNFSPLYDWSYTDVWKAIHANGWAYCPIYDHQYQYGVPLQNMRVSNLHHETATNSLYYLQEVERETFEALARRLPGVHTIGQMKNDAFTVPKELPFMFESWQEYRDHLCTHFVVHEKSRNAFQHRFAKMDIKYARFPNKERMYRAQIKAMMANDWEGALIDNWEANPWVHGWVKWTKGREHERNAQNPYIIRTMSLEAACK